MTSSAKAEPQGSEPSSTESLNALCRCGHQRRRHLEPPGAQCVACSGDEERSWRHEFEPKEPSKTVLFERYDPTCVCGCPKSAHMGLPRGCIKHAFHEFDLSLPHARSVPEPPLTPEEEEEAPEDTVRPCTCGVVGDQKHKKGCEALPPPEGPEDCGCGDPLDAGAEHRTDGPCAMKELPPPEGPEYTPCLNCGHIEPEHDFAAKRCTVGNEEIGCGCDGYRVEQPPPQPERRPPYVATYSVGGHLYEVAVPGDACLEAMDGALVIRHGLGPVAGLTGFQPLTVEEKA